MSEVGKPILIFHFDQAPAILQMMAFKPQGKKYVILIPTGICETDQFENRLNIVRANDIMMRMGVTRSDYAGQTTHCDGVHYRVFIV